MPSPTHTLWPLLPATLANEILLSVQKSNKKLYRTALEVMAPRMGVRVPILIEMPKTQRHAVWIQILARPEMEVLSFRSEALSHRPRSHGPAHGRPRADPDRNAQDPAPRRLDSNPRPARDGSPQLPIGSSIAPPSKSWPRAWASACRS